MRKETYQMIDLQATGQNIQRLMNEKEISVRTLQQFFGFEAPNAIYKWMHGESLPNLDNLFALAGYFHVTIDEILIPREHKAAWKTLEL